MRGIRLRLVLMAGLVAAAIPVAPVAAATTRWVAKDGTAGPATCAGAAPASKTIQAAVSASTSGDTVIVCNGTYRELVVIGNRSTFTLKSANIGKAQIRTPATVSSGTTSLVRIVGGSRVTLQGFTLLADTVAPCWQPAVLVEVNAATRVSLANLTMKAQGGDSIGACGYLIGAATVAGGKFNVTDSLIQDFASVGLQANANGKITAKRVSLRFLHAL